MSYRLSYKDRARVESTHVAARFCIRLEERLPKTDPNTASAEETTLDETLSDLECLVPKRTSRANFISTPTPNIENWYDVIAKLIDFLGNSVDRACCLTQRAGSMLWLGQTIWEMSLWSYYAVLSHLSCCIVKLTYITIHCNIWRSQVQIRRHKESEKHR